MPTPETNKHQGTQNEAAAADHQSGGSDETAGEAGQAGPCGRSEEGEKTDLVLPRMVLQRSGEVWRGKTG